MSSENQREKTGKQTLKDRYQEYYNDSEVRYSWEGHRAEEYDPGPALNYHEDTYQEPSGHIT